MGVSVEIRMAVICADAGRCFYCGHPATGVDHIDSRKAGGSDRPDNLVAACATCNGLKRDNPLPAAVRDEAKVTAFIRADLIQRMADEARAGSKRASSRRIIPIMERDYR